MTPTEKSDAAIQVLVPRSVRDKIEKLAKRNGRSLSGEARFALTTYVARKKA